MKRWHRVLFGADPFLDLAVDSRNLRVQCEYELQARLHLSEGPGGTTVALDVPATVLDTRK